MFKIARFTGVRSVTVYLLRFLRLNRGSDARVLKAQLDLTAMSVQATRFTSPLWSLLVALLCSSLTGLFGHHSVAETLYLPIIVSAAIALSASLSALYLRRT